MNVLADIQKKCFEQGISQDEYTQKRDAFLNLYFKLRRKNESSFLGRLSLNTRKKLHPLLLTAYKIKNRLSGFTYTIVADKREATARPIIFAITHVGKYDIVVVSEAVKEHYYLLTGDYEHLQGTVYEYFLSINGVLYVNETVQGDRKAVVDKMVALLRQGGNLMYFPEGTWNLSPNLPMLPCYWGIIEVARQGDAIIVPVAAEQYGKHFDINIGQNFYMEGYGTTVEEKSKAISDLRDVLASLKWEIWERHPTRRKAILDHEWDENLSARFQEWPGFDFDYIDRLVYKPKHIVSSKDAFAHLCQLKPCRENAFLFQGYSSR